MGRRATDKKERLVVAALRRFHHDGVAASSIAAVANDAGVPPGNVFYYFPSKDKLTHAVIDRWSERVAAHLEGFESEANPLDRVAAFLRAAEGRRQGYADSGCPLAALSSDLRQGSDDLASASGRPLIMMRDWIAAQFQAALGNRVLAAGHADFCLSSLQGSYALAQATADPAIVTHAVDHLIDWIATLQR